jgi:YbgC/YbaW family acyl-CoA thioester hydrolase
MDTNLMQYLGSTEIITRNTDLDSFAHVNNAHYIRYLETARYDVLEKIFDGAENVFSRGYIFMVTAIEAQFIAPLTAPNHITVFTFFSRMEKVRGIFLQEIHDADGKVVFRGEVEWAVIKLNNSIAGGKGEGKLCRIRDFLSDFQKLDHHGQIILSKNTNLAARIAPGKEKINFLREFYNEKIKKNKIIPGRRIHSWQAQSRFSELDIMQHINHAVYFSYFEEARWHLFLSMALDLKNHLAQDATFILGGQFISYKKPIWGHEALQINVQICQLRQASCFMHQWITNSKGEWKASGVSKLVFYDRGKKRPVPWDRDIRKVLEDAI